MLATYWKRSGVLRRPDAFLGRSKGRLELTFDQHGKEDEKERLDFRKILQNSPNRACDVGVLADLLKGWWTGVTASQPGLAPKTIEKHMVFEHFLSKTYENTKF